MRRSDRAPAGRGARARAVAAACGAIAVAALVHPRAALAFCRTSVCPETQSTAAVCTPPQSTDCGIPLAWPSPCVGYSIQEDASDQVSLAETEAIFAQAFAAWTAADCGGGETPRMEVTYMGPVSCDAHEYNQRQGNANIITFRDDGWPYGGSGSTLALTTVTYNLKTGAIYDADMEINSFDQKFTLGDDGVGTDLLSVATHEAGHFLGLSHSRDPEATMMAHYNDGTVLLRDLHDDDIAGICAVYPPGEPVKGCDPTPRHGFSDLCAADQPSSPRASGGCTAAPSPVGGGGWLLAAALASLGAIARARRGATARPGRKRAP